MADRPISELTAVTTVNSTDEFVLQQSNRAMKLTGQVLLNWLATALAGHGGISTIAKTGTDVTTDTYTITFADQTTSTFTVTNGRGISSIAKTGTSGLTDTYTVTYNDNTTSTFTVTNGAKGDKGDNSYVHFMYSANRPSSDAEMHLTADNWIGIYSGNSSTAPTSYTAYTWFEMKGEKGDTGDDVTISSTSIKYGTSEAYDSYPENWYDSVPYIPQGAFLWARTTVVYSTGASTTSYSVARNGMDGTGGTVRSVHGVASDTNGNCNPISINGTVLAIGSSNVT